MKKLFVQSYLSFSSFFECSFFPLNFSCSYLINDFRRKFLFLCQTVTEIDCTLGSNLRTYFIFDTIKCTRLLFLESDIALVVNIFQDFSNSFFRRQFEIKTPVKGLFHKLRFRGFVHLYKRRPVANINYIFFEDWLIIRSFGYLAYSILNWFLISKNFFFVKFVVEFIRESCFLTLSRKHNKTKSWSYRIYTSDLIVFQNLFFLGSFFPTKKLVNNFSKKDLCIYFLFLEDKFFLDEIQMNPII